MDKDRTYKDKYVSILGDSISTFEGISEPRDAVYYDAAHKLASGVLTPSDTWWGRAIGHFGGRLLVNNSFSGSTVCFQPRYEIPSYGCSDERTASLDRDGVSPDVILIHMGTNDWGWGIRVFHDGRYGGISDGRTLFSTAYGQMLEKLKTNYPRAEIWCLTLPVGGCSAKADFSFPYCYGGRHLADYNEAIRLCAEKWGCGVIDLYGRSEPCDTVDGSHPTSSGMKTIADAVIEALEDR